MLSPMAEEEDSNASNLLQPQQFPSPFIEVTCKSSGNIRRFSVGTEASFALKLINKKLSLDQPSASYIEAYKQGEEPISFGFNSVLLDYGDGWKLQTVPDEEEGSQKQKGLVFNQHEEYSNVMALAKNHDILLGDVDLHLEDPLQDLERPMGSELMSDVESQLERYDLSEYFTTDQVFNTREELVKWTRDVGKTVGTVVVIKKSGSGLAGRAPRIAFGCERGGRYRIAKRGGVNKMPPRRKSGTKKCECPFVLRGIKLPEDDQWKVKVECGIHNHPLTRSPEGHSYGGKLTPEEEELVLELSKNGAKPKEVLNALKERDVHNLTTMHTIYCTRQKLNLTRKSKRNQPTLES